MFRRARPLTIRAILVAALGLSVLTVPSVTPQASAANPDCAPTTAGNINVRLYIFSNTTLCDWVIPSGWGDFTIEVVGGGGGGGGGSWSGATGGGGGGGGVGDLYKRPLSQTPGTRISLVAGTGGTAGNGAASQGTAAGTNGGDGSASTVFISSSESYTALGGSGGSAGNGDVGGTGGSGFKNSQYFVTQQAPYLGARISGGSENSGNGGAGGFTGYEANATASNPGRSATSNGLLNSIQDKTAGFGGARTGTSQLANDNLKPTSRGGSSTVASAPGKSNSGSGGGGGAGCSGTLSVCNNKNGSAGGSGYILIYGNLRTVVSHPNTFSTDPSVGLRVLAVGVTPSYPTITVNNQIGSVSWSISPSLPAGITLNSSSGQLSGVPQTATAKTDYRPMATDSFGSIDTDSWTFQVNKGTGAVPTFTASNIVYNVPTALVASGGSGTGAFTFASSDPNCVLSGSRGETVTAQKASGTCSITVTKAGDSNYYSASKSATFTMVKQPSTLSIAVSPASPRQDGTQITITATVGSGQTGTVTFTAGGSAIGSCGTAGAVTISGTSAICTWTPTASGSPFTLSATYSGDANYQGSSSNSISYTIYPSISLSYPSVSTTFGSAKTSTPTISGGTGSTSSWSWSVVRTSDSSTVSGITINSSGVVSVSSSLAAATYSMRVNATDTVGVTKSVLLPVVVGLSGGAATTISASKTATTVSGSIELRATVVTGATGTIAFKFGSTTITGCGTVTITSGSAACTWTPASASGSPFTVTAVYSGDSNFSTNTSAGQVITVNPAGTFTYTSQNYVFGSERSINASISGGTGAFSTWTIVNTSDNQSDNRVSINDAGRITIAPNLPVGTYTFAISASDEEAINGSGTIVITVTKSSPTVTLSARMVDGTIVTSGTLGRQVRLVVNLSTPAGGQATISGNSTTLCTVFIFNGAGECWWAPTDASASPYTISASFTGTTDANSATSNQLTNFAWNPSISISYTNRSIETGKLATISPTISGGTGARNLWSWSISQFFTGDSIGGISINNSGVISIGASVQPDTYTMVVGGADLAGAVEYANVTITIANQVAPKISLSNSSETITVNSALTGFTISNTGSDVSAFSIDGTLPAGLSFDTSTGLLAGTPSETLTVTTFIISASNFSGSDTATFTLTINSAGGGGGGSATVTISLTGGATTAAKGTPIAITATVNITGKVSFYINGKPISGCTARHTTSSVSCTWKPAIQGQSVTLSALLRPSSVNYTNARSNLLQVGVGRRTGRR